METTKGRFDVARHGKITLVVETIPSKSDVTEEGTIPIGSDFVTGVGKCFAEEVCVLLSCVFNPEVVNDEGKKRGLYRCYVPRGMECA